MSSVTPLRRCGKCKQDAVDCFHYTLHSVNGLPTGTTYNHRCKACGWSFSTISLWRAVTESLSGALLAGIGWSLAPSLTRFALGVPLATIAGRDWFLLGIMWLMALIGTSMLAMVATRTWRRIENPVADTAG